MRHFKKTWESPRHPWRKEILIQEIDLLGKYGLRNKKELWKAKTILRKIRSRARKLLALPSEIKLKEEEILKSKLIKMGLIEENSTIEDILALNVEDILKRRLQTILYDLKLANSLYHARQLVAHKKVIINNKVISSPSYLVKKEEEKQIRLR